MSDLQETMKNPHPDPARADHHQPVLDHRVVGRPHVLPPPMPDSPPVAANWNMAPSVVPRNKARMERRPHEFQTTVLLSEAEARRRSVAAATASSRSRAKKVRELLTLCIPHAHAQRGPGPHMPRMAPPPSAHLRSNTHRSKARVVRHRSSSKHVAQNDGQVEARARTLALSFALVRRPTHTRTASVVRASERQGALQGEEQGHQQVQEQGQGCPADAAACAAQAAGRQARGAPA
jgi:hypothetical protein